MYASWMPTFSRSLSGCKAFPTNLFANSMPFGYAGGDVNLYRYVNNNPINSNDPTGLFNSDNHKAITKDALNGIGISSSSLDRIVIHNTNQDDGSLTNVPPFSDPLNHADDDKIEDTILRIKENMDKCKNTKNITEFLVLAGKVTHAVQDLYAHTTYVEQMDSAKGGKSKPGDLPIWDLFDSKGKPYRPTGVISGTYAWPRDNAPSPSHAELGKDSENCARGKLTNTAGTSYFELAKDLATRHTKSVWEQIWSNISKAMQKELKTYKYQMAQPPLIFYPGL
jgi:hypothetical protein